MNKELALRQRISRRAGDVVLVKCEKDEDGNPKDIRGSTARQQDMNLWEGVELVGCTRKSKSEILNGCIYVVERVETDTVTVRLHEDYRAAPEKFNKPHVRAALAPFLAEVQDILKEKPCSPA